MISHSERSTGTLDAGFVGGQGYPEPWQGTARGRILVIEDEEVIRESLEPLLEQEGYEVSFAENGREALRRLYTETHPDIIVLDLRMPVMDGWEFRTIQKQDPQLGLIPVVAISADGSAQAAAISAQAYLRKPVDPKQLLLTIAKILLDSERAKVAARRDDTERLASLGRLAAGVGHEINNPLAFVMLNLSQSLEKLRPPPPAAGTLIETLAPEVELAELKTRVADVAEMLDDCQVGSERIRETVDNLQRLSRSGEPQRVPLDLHKLIEQSVSMVWNQIRHRARLVRTFGKIPLVRGNGTALGQVFLNLLLNAAQAIPDGDADRNEIRIETKLDPGINGAEIVVEVSDSGRGIAPEIVGHVFEPFFTTKSVGQGTGLGLSLSRQTITDHGGRMTVDSDPGKGTVFRIFLPIGHAPVAPRSIPALATQSALFRGRVLVIDDEPLIGRIIRTALSDEHDVFATQRASDALTRLEHGETFDLVLCDVLMPDLSGPEFYATILKRWPELIPRLVFMTGGAFTPETVAFMERVPTRVLTKPFKIDRLKRLVRERMRGSS
jgi:signal transduction histidine kinase